MNTTTTFTVKLGTNKPNLKGVFISAWAQDLLDKTEYQKEKETIELIVKTPKELGCTSEYLTTDEIYAAAQVQGLELCPAEVGPRLRKVYKGTDWLVIAMKQISVRAGYPRVFNLDDGGGKLRLGASHAEPGKGWTADYRFVFRLRKDTLGSGTSESGTLGNFASLEARIKSLEEWKERVQDALGVIGTA